MPFKHHAARRHRIPRALYRITNWPAYEAGLRRRGDLTLWLDKAALESWTTPRRTSPGGQPLYSELAIELVLTLRLVFNLTLRQAGGFARGVMRLLRLHLPVPDHTTLSQRGRSFARRRPRVPVTEGAIHVVLDKRWPGDVQTRRMERQQTWQGAAEVAQVACRCGCRHGRYTAHILTDGHVEDALQVPALLNQTEGQIASVTADGAYDTDPVYQALPLDNATRHQLLSSHLVHLPC